ncbi:MAG: isoprenylcysteine carboxylmethyltransferase family protein [Nibricoccus sp.]
MSQPEQDRPNIIALPPLIFLACLGVGAALHLATPFRLTGAWLLRSAGGVMMLAAGIIASVAARVMRKAGTHIRPDKPTTVIVASGPYRFTRNPMYLSLCLLNAGIGLLARSPAILILTAALLAVLHFGVILREEKYLAKKFGPTYLDYCNRVRRWF